MQEAFVLNPSTPLDHPCDRSPDGPPRLGTFAELQQELRRRGLFDKDPKRIVWQFSAHLLLTLLGILLCVFSLHWSMYLLGTAIWTIGLLGIGTNTHTATHSATFRSKRWNDLFAWIGYPILLGFSATFWREKHVVLHHASPNVVGMDGDIDFLPLFAITDRDKAKQRGIARLYYKLQWLVLPFALALNGLSMQAQGVRFLFRHRCATPAERRRRLIDALCLAFHAATWIGLPLLVFPAADVLMFYALRSICVGIGLFVILAPGHLPREAACVMPAARNPNPATQQIRGTVNFRTGWLGRFVCSGLEYQIEHHLFPNVSHTRLPEVSVLVRDYCRLHGLPYRTLGWAEAVVKSFAVFVVPKPVVVALGD
jgi:linoleoyl-CoA desaturase